MDYKQVAAQAKNIISTLNNRDTSLSNSAHPKIKKAHENMCAGLYAVRSRLENTNFHHEQYIRAIINTKKYWWEIAEKLDQHLFGFFHSGLSAIECCVYGIYNGCKLISLTDFPLDEHEITISSLVSGFPVRSDIEPFAEALYKLTRLREYKEWKKARDVLTHRGIGHQESKLSPKGKDMRTNLVLDARLTIPLTKQTTEQRFKWLVQELDDIISVGDELLTKLQNRMKK